MRYLITFILVLVLFVGCKKGENPVDPWDSNNAMGQPCPGIPTVTYSGKTYNTIAIKNQCWMKKNLNVGTRINGIQEQNNNGIIEKYCYNDLESNCNTYGGLYQWNEMMQYTTMQGAQGICPTGWHLPTDAEWTALANALPSPDKGSRLAGNEPLWTNGALDQSAYFGTSGFAALPAGYRYTAGSFFLQGGYAYFWSSTENGTLNAWFRSLYYNNTDIYQYYDNKAIGYSVRCVQN